MRKTTLSLKPDSNEPASATSLICVVGWQKEYENGTVTFTQTSLRSHHLKKLFSEEIGKKGAEGFIKGHLGCSEVVTVSSCSYSRGFCGRER